MAELSGDGVGERAVTGQLTPVDCQGIADALFKHMEPWLAAPPSRLVDARTLAQELAVSIHYVYEHKRELGAVRIGNGKKPRLRFDLAEAKAAFRQREQRPAYRVPDTTRRRKRRRVQTNVPLLPVSRRAE